MPQDIYGNDVNYASTSIITAHKMLLTIEGQDISSIGALVQNIAIQYAQPVQIIREVGSKNYYYFSQLPQGSVSFGRLVATDRTILDILPSRVAGTGKNIWEVPDEGEQSPKLSLRSIEDNRVQYEMFQCIVESFGVNVDVNAQFVQEQVVIRFGALNILSDQAVAAP